MKKGTKPSRKIRYAVVGLGHIAQVAVLPAFRTARNAELVQDVDPENVRVMPVAQGGGPVYDMGVYCINAARHLFQSEPIGISALSESNGEPRFKQSEEMTSVLMRFPGDRLATFTCSF